MARFRTKKTKQNNTLSEEKMKLLERYFATHNDIVDKGKTPNLCAVLGGMLVKPINSGD